MLKKVALLCDYNAQNSLSPFIHNYWMEKYNICCEYNLQFVNHHENIRLKLAELLLDNYVGFNVTSPYKEKVIPFVDCVDKDTFQIGALNTINVIDNKFYASNTDHYGFINALNHRYPNCKFSKALILGAGGSSKAIIYALINHKKAKIVYLCNRSNYRLLELQNRFGDDIIKKIDFIKLIGRLREYDLIVNTIPNYSDFLNIIIKNIMNLSESCIVCDITYLPKIFTPLLLKAQEYGLRILTGLDMLIWQAIRSFSIWFGIVPEFNNILYEYCLNMRN